LNSGLALVDSELQVNLEIALSGASAKVKPPNRLFRTGRKCVETSDDVIKNDLISIPDSRIWDFSLMRLGAAKTQGNRRNPRMIDWKTIFPFDKS
jgi:hypothetical protein